jgi:hypothetical protein
VPSQDLPFRGLLWLGPGIQLVWVLSSWDIPKTFPRLVRAAGRPGHGHKHTAIHARATGVVAMGAGMAPTGRSGAREFYCNGSATPA